MLVGMHPARVAFAIGLFLISVSSKSFAAFPSSPGENTWDNRPNDPGYKHAWNLFSHLPVNHTGVISAFEKQIGSGVHADKAWQYHVGTPDTVIAVLDSGIYWEADDLIERFYLNKKELPLPLGSQSYDKNGDGRFSVSDYAEDSRVSDKNKNGKLDPGDLIAVFSDGIDDDKNGYVDDISGWDFHEFDNDAADRTRFGHGTGEAYGSAAALNNGIGHSGICGDCSIVPLRLNDSFIVDANAFAQAVVYATDLGVSLVQQALGSVNNSIYVREAVEYAYSNGVPIIGSAADENSYHHNYPSTLDPIIYPNAIRYDSKDYPEATTFLNFNNCSNYGARVDVSVPGKACSSEATAILSGMSGLTLSYARSLNRALTPGELNALIKIGATDINLGPNDNDPFRHSTYAGWDTITGYGRANTANMFQAIRESKIPAEVRIVSPQWFELYRYSKDEQVDVFVDVRSREAGASVTLEVLKGVETSKTKPTVLKKLSLERENFSGEFVSFKLSDLKKLSGSELEVPRNRYAYTLRLRVVTKAGVASETRKTIFAFEDSRLLAGFPARLLGSGESMGFFLDLNADGADEFVTADGSGYVHAFTADGSELSGFPAQTALSRYQGTTPTLGSIVSPVAGGDLDSDGKPEIVAVSMEGQLSVIDNEGKQKPGFPLTLPFPKMEEATSKQIIANGVIGAPVLVDLDGDNKLEIVVVAFDGKIHVYRNDGSVQKGFPYTLLHDGKKAKLLSSPAIYDVDRDGTKDLILGSNHVGKNVGFVFVVSGKGNLEKRQKFPGFPVRIPLIRDSILPTIGVGIPTAPALADTDGDGSPEILVHPFVGKSYLIGLDGKYKTSLSMKVSDSHQTNDTHMISAFGHPAFGDILGDGLLRPLGVGVGRRALTALALGGKRYEAHHMLGAWDPKSGKMISGFPKRLEDTLLSPSPISADLNNDGKADAIVGSGGYFLHAHSVDGAVEGFPHFTGGWMYGTPSVGDIDGDGQIDVAVTTREGYAFVWKTAGLRKNLKSAWPTFKGNPKRTGSRISED